MQGLSDSPNRGSKTQSLKASRRRKKSISKEKPIRRATSQTKSDARSREDDRHSAERTRVSEIRYRRLFETAHDGVLILDAVTRKITDANPFITQLLGYRLDELVGKELWEIGLLKDERRNRAVFRELQGKGEIRYENLPLRTKTGAKHEVEVVANRYDEDGRQVVQCNIRDITDRKRIEDALHKSEARSRELFELAEVARVSAQEARARAEAATRAKDDFLAALSHELRTPLTPALLLASSMTGDDTLPASVRSDIDVIAKSIALQARLIDDLLDLTRISSGKLKLELRPVDTHAALRRAFEIVRSEIAERTISFDLGATQSCIMADVVRLQQIFWNVLKNAVKFTPPNGEITIRTANPQEKEGALLVQIADNGVGIEPGMLERVFEVFTQEEHGAHRFGGVGLGLAITRRLVQLQDGKISVESAGRNRGATFDIELPVAPAELCSQEVDSEVGRTTIAKAGRILLVEDHEETRLTLARLLKRRGHSVIAVATAAAARESVKTGNFDLIIMDLGLPDQDGHALMTELRKSHNVRGVALSGYGTDEDMQRSKRAGFLAHLTKPVDIILLEKAIAAAL